MRSMTHEMENKLFAAVKALMAQGKYESSYVSDIVEQQSVSDSPVHDDVIKRTTATAYMQLALKR